MAAPRGSGESPERRDVWTRAGYRYLPSLRQPLSGGDHAVLALREIELQPYLQSHPLVTVVIGVRPHRAYLDPANIDDPVGMHVRAKGTDIDPISCSPIGRQLARRRLDK